MSRLHSVKAYLRHWLHTVDQHSIHSPFFYDFYNRVLKAETAAGENAELEELRSRLLTNETVLEIEDLGAGSRKLTGNRRTLAEIAQTSMTPREQAELYLRIIRYFEAERIVELGSGLGITTLYLAKNPDATVFTFEGSHALANVALTNYEYFDKKNIRLVEGNIQTTLPDFLQDPSKINFVLMDANHRYEPTVKYFNWLIRRLDEKSVVVVDDIHWSEEMEKAWSELRSSPLVYGSVDLFQFGILFFDPSLNRQHFTWSF